MVFKTSHLHHLYLKPSAWSDHVNTRRFEGKFSGEDELSVIHSAFIWRLFRSRDDIVPFEDVGGKGSGGHVRNWIFDQPDVVLFQSSRRRRARQFHRFLSGHVAVVIAVNAVVILVIVFVTVVHNSSNLSFSLGQLISTRKPPSTIFIFSRHSY